MGKERLRECREALQRLDPFDRGVAVGNNLATIVAVLLDVVDELLGEDGPASDEAIDGEARRRLHETQIAKARALKGRE